MIIYLLCQLIKYRLHFSCETCGKMFRSHGGLKQHLKGNEKCLGTQEEVVKEVDHVQAVVLVDKQGQQFFQLEDGTLMPADDTTIYTIQEDDVNTKVFIQ